MGNRCLGETFSAGYKSHALQAGWRTSFEWIDRNGYELRPEIGGSVTTYRQAGISEAGGTSFGLNVAAAHAETYIAHIGINGRMPRMAPEVPIRPVGFVRFEHDLAINRDHAIGAALQVNPANSQSFIGQGRGPSTITAGLGLASDSPGRLQIEGGVAMASHVHGKEWGAGLRLRYVW